MRHSYRFELKGFVTISLRAPSRKIASSLIAELGDLPIVLDAASRRKNVSINDVTFYADDEHGPFLLEVNGREVDF